MRKRDAQVLRELEMIRILSNTQSLLREANRIINESKNIELVSKWLQALDAHKL